MNTLPEALLRAGVPARAWTPAARAAAVDAAELRAALRRATDELPQLGDGDRDALRAWLAAWRSHWPDRFANDLGVEGETAWRRLQAERHDPNRHLKLRRIALATLSARL